MQIFTSSRKSLGHLWSCLLEITWACSCWLLDGGQGLLGLLTLNHDSFPWKFTTMVCLYVSRSRLSNASFKSQWQFLQSPLGGTSYFLLHKATFCSLFLSPAHCKCWGLFWDLKRITLFKLFVYYLRGASNRNLKNLHLYKELFSCEENYYWWNSPIQPSS